MRGGWFPRDSRNDCRNASGRSLVKTSVAWMHDLAWWLRLSYFKPRYAELFTEITHIFPNFSKAHAHLSTEIVKTFISRWQDGEMELRAFDRPCRYKQKAPACWPRDPQAGAYGYTLPFLLQFPHTHPGPKEILTYFGQMLALMVFRCYIRWCIDRHPLLIKNEELRMKSWDGFDCSLKKDQMACIEKWIERELWIIIHNYFESNSIWMKVIMGFWTNTWKLCFPVKRWLYANAHNIRIIWPAFCVKEDYESQA